MKGHGSALMGMLLLSLTACAQTTGPPEIVIDRTACDHCAMLISDKGFAVAFQFADQPAQVFDDIACMLSEFEERENFTEATVWVHAYDQESWLGPNEAFLVRTDRLETPMGGRTVAVTDRDAANQLVAQFGGEIVDGIAGLSRRQPGVDL